MYPGSMSPIALLPSRGGGGGIGPPTPAGGGGGDDPAAVSRLRQSGAKTLHPFVTVDAGSNEARLME